MTLENLLSSRLDGGDPRAHVGAIERSGDGSITILFAAIGDAPRIVLGVEGGAIALLEQANPETEEPEMADVNSGERVARLGSAATTEQPNPPPPSNAEATRAFANATGGANGVEGESATGNASKPAPAFVGKDDYSKPELIELARATPGAEFTEDNNKAEIAQAINAATGAVPPTE